MGSGSGCQLARTGQEISATSPLKQHKAMDRHANMGELIGKGTLTQTRITLAELLRNHPSSEKIFELVQQLEQEQPADLSDQLDQLTGTWELRWSSSSQPWLKQSPGPSQPTNP
jgi:hypothetical protein